MDVMCVNSIMFVLFSALSRRIDAFKMKNAIIIIIIINEDEGKNKCTCTTYHMLPD